MDKVATVDPDDLEKEALAAAAEARTLDALAEVRVRYVGRQSALKLALREVRDRETGMTLNAVRETVESALSAKEAELARAELEERLATERVDVTLPAQLLGPPKLRPRGTLPGFWPSSKLIRFSVCSTSWRIAGIVSSAVCTNCSACRRSN